jgi:flagellar protein FlaG
MSVLQSGLDLSSANSIPEYAKRNELENNAISSKGGDEKIDKANNVIKQESINKNIDSSHENEVLTPEQLDKVAQQLQDFVGEMNTGLEFSVDKDSGRDVIKVIDKSSGDLVKQYPSEEVLTLVSKLSEMVGGFVDAKV